MALYQSPDGMVDLGTVRPLLATWERRGHSTQLAMTDYLSKVGHLVASSVDPRGRNAIRIDVGAGREGDLDNWLYPVVASLGSGHFVTAWASKGWGTPRIGVEPAVRLAGGLDDSWLHLQATTNVSASTPAWKEQLAEQIPRHDFGERIELQVAYRLSEKRNWATLWKPTLDSLGAILGDGPRRFHPCDDRIELLAFHRTVDESVGWNIDVDVWARRVASRR
jgi:hypothetical protein